MNQKHLKQFTLILLTTFVAVSCMDKKFEDINSNLNYANFDFKTTRDIQVNIEALSNENLPLNGVGISVFTTNPLNEDGTWIENADSLVIFRGSTGSNGKMSFVIAPPTTVDSITVLVNYIGLPALHQAKIVGSELNFKIGGKGSTSSAPRKVVASGLESFLDPKKENGYFILGSWNNSGLPDYLTSFNDKISKELLEDINATLPESIKLQDSHPEYLNSEDDGSIVLIEDAEVWVTFVHEGAGYKNTLGYYTHSNDNPPVTAKDIADATVIFPNLSFSGSGGQLTSGNKVQLLYYDKDKKEYTKVFPSGTTIAWWFASNGFNGGAAGKLGDPYFMFYSDVRFNPEKDAAKRKHNVLLADDARQLLLIGFEDLQREQRPDDDFNDAVFYATVTPYRAVKEGIYKKIDTPRDSDGDGVSDTMDEYPLDPHRAFNNYYPSKNQVGTLAFEDMWPVKGDYDFNDLVVDYRFNQVTNAKNMVVDINAEITIKAIGASLRNAFAIGFNTDADNISKVSGQILNGEVFNTNEIGVELNQMKAVIPVFDDPFKVLDYVGSLVNTVNGSSYITPRTINLKVEFKEPIDISALGTPPYNPFMVPGGNRAKEIHLSGSEPTDLTDFSLFGTGHDDSDVSKGKFYMSDRYLPWAINIPVMFNYPEEKQDITKAFLMFNNWAKSKGFNYMDWYEDKNGYRDAKKIFQNKK